MFRNLLNIVSILFLFPAVSWTQIDTTIEMEEVVVRSFRLQDTTVGHRSEIIDLDNLSTKSTGDLTALLSEQSSIYLKNYGPGRIATTSMRGLSASHTAVLWNGLNIQSPFLGLQDFSLLPVQFADEVKVNYGSEGALWGSGTIGGSIHFNTFNQNQQPGWSLDWQGHHGSFQNWRTGLRLRYKKTKFASSTKLFYQFARNDYSYTKLNGESQKLPNAEGIQYGLMQEAQFRINDRNQVALHFWGQQAERQIAPTRSQSVSVANQKDDWLRFSADWKRTGEQVKWFARTAWFTESILYQDSLVGIDNNSDAQTLIGELEASWQIGKVTFRTGLNQTSVIGRTENYNGAARQSRTALLGAADWTSLNKHLHLGVRLRQSLIEEELVPFLFNLVGDWKVDANWSFHGNAGKSFRYPTLNDLYWSPGGNPGLRPEKSWNIDLGARYRLVQDKFIFSIRSTLFNHWVEDWIQWLPVDALWQPLNIQNVWSRGLENELSLDYAFQPDLSIQLKGRIDFLKTTRADNYQLIYAPRQKAGGQMTISYRSWQMVYNHQYTSKVYTLSDNSDYLPAYHLGNLGIGKSIPIDVAEVECFFQVRNIWDSDYEVVALRPMPDRHYAVSIFLSLNN